MFPHMEFVVWPLDGVAGLTDETLPQAARRERPMTKARPRTSEILDIRALL
jgi:hypothetical protein